MFVNVAFTQDLALNSSPSKKMLIEANFVKKEVVPRFWSTTAARTIRQGRIEKGLFAPLRFGLKDNLEIQVHPILFFVMPNARLKKNWTLNQSNKLQVATEHGFTYPTILLNLLSKSGVGGIFPSTRTAPAILTVKNKLIASYYYHRLHSISLKAAMEFNLLQAMGNNFPEIELLLIYPRTAVYNNTYTGEVAISFEGVVAKKIGYDSDIRMFLIPNNDFTWVLEWNPKLYYNASNNFRIMAGAIVTTGNIKNEKAAFRAMPVLDLQFTIGQKSKRLKKKK